jgi:hypothetical protein
MTSFTKLSLPGTVLYIADGTGTGFTYRKEPGGGSGKLETHERITIRIAGDPTEMHGEYPKQNSRTFHPHSLLCVCVCRLLIAYMYDTGRIYEQTIK